MSAQPDNQLAWRKIEAAKHGLFYTLLRLKLPLGSGAENSAQHLAFDFLAAPLDGNGPKIMTGHDNGLITIALSEADDVDRERRRSTMHEPYRTLHHAARPAVEWGVVDKVIEKRPEVPAG
jgi:hypothetical protein